MADVRVVVTFDLDRALVERIRQVDPRVRVSVLSLAQRRLFRGGRLVWRRSSEMAKGVEESEEDARRGLDEALAQAEVLLTLSTMPTDLLSRAPRLKWIQLTSAGADRLVNREVLQGGIPVTTAGGIHVAPIGEYVLGMIIMLAKGWPHLFRAQQAREWARLTPQELEGKTVGVIGLGNVGQEVARLVKLMGMRVLGVRRSGEPLESSEHLVDEIFAPLDLLHVLSQSDYVVLAVPLTEETHHLMGELAFQAMKPSAYLINVSPGAVVDETALLRALKVGLIGGAGLDVFESEPLPQESELWRLHNVMISPHIAGETAHYNEGAVALFCDNLRRYLADEPLLNLVDPQRGY
jgi:phosphoglycerate dehydrogenase-like enzyme